MLIGGAQVAVERASVIARRFGVPQLVIGLTLVAFGTGLPEFVLNVLSASQGSTSLAFGNLVGASTINVSLVLGLVAIISPLTVQPSVITREIPLMILSCAALLALSADSHLGRTNLVDVLDRPDGIILLLFFSIFIYYTIFDVMKSRKEDVVVAHLDEQRPNSALDNYPLSSLITVALLGMLSVAIGARMVLEGATGIASALGVTESIIGLTIVSLGTTLPELTTCLVAARKKQHDLVLGNLVGSNILNLLLFFGITSLIHPIPLPDYGLYDLLLLSLVSLSLAPIALRGPMRITRSEGVFLVSTYVIGTILRIYLSA